MENNIYSLRKLIRSHNNIVFIGGAGVSTASGIPDFRGKNGLYTTSKLDNPELTLSHEYIENNTAKFYEYYRKNMVIGKAKPNVVHYKLAELEQNGRLKAVITQNIDGLHQLAGSKNVLELHGTARECYCIKCKRKFTADYIEGTEHDVNGIPKCDACDGYVRPNVVLYGEQLDNNLFNKAIDYVVNADLLIVAGTTLRVFPVASLVEWFRYGDTNKHFVILNNTATPYDYRADLILRSNLEDIFSNLNSKV